MTTALLYAEKDVDVDLASIAKNLNRICKFVQFRVGSEEVNLHDEIISNPGTYDRLDRAVREEAAGAKLVFIATDKPYDNNFFFHTRSPFIVLSFHFWEGLTSLPRNNGLVFFIADLLSLGLDNSVRHEDTTGCIYDFGWDKTSVDVEMRAAMMCQECHKRLSTDLIDVDKIAIFRDVLSVLDDLGMASKREMDVVELWELLAQVRPNNDAQDQRPNLTAKGHGESGNNQELLRLYEMAIQPKLEAAERGKRFEDFAQAFFGQISGWKLIPSRPNKDRDHNMGDGEIDLMYDIGDGPPFLKDRLGHCIYVECKNRKKKSSVGDIDHFIKVFTRRNLKAGIFISLGGISGYKPEEPWKARYGYKAIVDEYHKHEHFVIPMVKYDILKVINGHSLVDMLRDKLNNFVQV